MYAGLVVYILVTTSKGGQPFVVVVYLMSHGCVKIGSNDMLVGGQRARSIFESYRSCVYGEWG